MKNRSYRRSMCLLVMMFMGGMVVHASQGEPKPRAQTSPAASPPATGPTSRPATQPDSPAMAKLEYVRLHTSKGDITLELNHEKAPRSVENFLKYVRDGHYDGTVFHRVIPNFMVQGGGFTAAGVQKPTGAGITNEWQNGLKNTRGTIAMARLGQQPNSATAQFFINLVDNGFLDEPRDGAGYAVFGRVISGMDVVDAIAKASTTVRHGMPNWPAEDIVVKSAERLSQEQARTTQPE